MLGEMGAQIKIEQDKEITRFGTKVTRKQWNIITVAGRESLKDVDYRVMPDRIEFGSYAIAAAMNNGR